MSSSAWNGRMVGIALVVAILIGGGLYALFGKSSDKNSLSGAPTPTVSATPTGTPTKKPRATASLPKVDTVVVTATAPVTVCARAGKRVVVNQKQLAAGEKTTKVRGKTVVVTATNRSIKLSVNGKQRKLPASTGPITVVVTGNGLKKASPSATACRV